MLSQKLKIIIWTSTKRHLFQCRTCDNKTRH